MGLINVVYPVYGNFDISRLEAAVVSAMNQDYPDLRILVSEQNERPRFESTAKCLNVDYIFSPNIAQEVFPSQSRNIALRNIHEGLVYMNDSDIVFLNKSYLKMALSMLADREFLIKPPLVHLRKCEVQAFAGRIRTDFSSAASILKYPNPYVVSLSDDAVDLEYNIHKGRLFIGYPDEIKMIAAPEDKKKQDAVIWHEVAHQGAILSRIEDLHQVGGYCDRYRSWGYEDTDIIWKLKSICMAKEIPKEKEFTVLHLDHEKPYFNADDRDSNRAIFHERKARGTTAIIDEDVKYIEAAYA
ncbi:MAG: glycosyltransferase family 2 protein [Nanoarchaeota archaeon]|nr:glycosyltransferase family 2 protein [Nanoarchaeota archaeon]